MKRLDSNSARITGAVRRKPCCRLLRHQGGGHSLTQSTGLNLIRHGINVNAIAPGVVDGDHWVHVDELFAKLEGKRPYKRRPKSKTVFLRAALPPRPT